MALLIELEIVIIFVTIAVQERKTTRTSATRTTGRTNADTTGKPADVWTEVCKIGRMTGQRT